MPNLLRARHEPCLWFHRLRRLIHLSCFALPSPPATSSLPKLPNELFGLSDPAFRCNGILAKAVTCCENGDVCCVRTSRVCPCCGEFAVLVRFVLTLVKVRFGDLCCGAAVGLPQLQRDAASAIAAAAQVRSVPRNRHLIKSALPPLPHPPTPPIRATSNGVRRCVPPFRWTIRRDEGAG